MSITFSNGGILVEDESELPDLRGKEMFLDMETTSFDKKFKSVNPWFKCWPLGIAIKVDSGSAYYVPLNHAKGRNLDPHRVQKWLINVINNVEVWINHNVKYDAQVLSVSFGVDTSKLKKHCTLDLAKILDSDRYRHDLSTLSYDWLKEDITPFEEAFKPYLKGNQDYGLVPIDLMGEYACQDTMTEARLWKYIKARMPAECQRVCDTSSDLIDCFIDIEKNGMRINPTEVATKELIALNEMSTIQSKIKDIVGYTIEPHVNNDCFDVLCNHYGFPVLAWNESGNPSFDKHTLASYKSLPGANNDLIDLMLAFRRLQTFTSVFTSKYRELHIDGLLHCSYKPTVRTGRMACAMPNMQQLMLEAKELIICNDDEVIIAADYSQIEFRIIAHYIQDAACIAAYQNDPWTDFHTWVKDMCHIHRTPAKTINFLMGYGGGKAKLIDSLIKVPELVHEIRTEIEHLDMVESQKLELFTARAKQRANEVYTTYHDTLPGLKRTARQAMNRTLEVGYCRNIYGRRRHLAAKAAHKAFNAVCQGSAADLMKDRLVYLWRWLLSHYPEIKLIGVVHDEVILRGPRQLISEGLLDSICYILEDVDVALRVPIRTSLGLSDNNWLEASKTDTERKFCRKNFEIAPL